MLKGDYYKKRSRDTSEYIEIVSNPVLKAEFEETGDCLFGGAKSYLGRLAGTTEACWSGGGYYLREEVTPKSFPSRLQKLPLSHPTLRVIFIR